MSIRDHVLEAVERAHVGVAVADGRWRFDWVNAAFARLLGGPREEVVGRTPFEVTAIGWKEGWLRDALRAMRRGDVWTGEIDAVSRWGRPVHVMASVSRIATSRGERAFTIVMHDVATENLLREQLFHAQRMEAMGRLAGGVAHAFNNSLQTLFNAFHLLKPRLGADPRSRELMATIERTLDSASGIANQLLAFARQRTLSPQPVRLGDLAAALEPLLRAALPEDVVLTLSIPPAAEDPVVEVDPAIVEQLLLNLCLNAAEAMDGTGEIAVRVRLDGTTSEAVLEVEDSGPGIPEEVAHRIFEPFFTTREGSHTGLGLAVADGIVAQLGGRILARNRPEGGARFTVRLPAVAAVEPLAATHLIQRTPSGGHPPVRGRILLVEDEEDLRETLLEILEEEGFQARGARDGREALAVVTEQGWIPDCLVSDLKMPGMTGQQLAVELRRLHPGMAIVLASGYHPDSLPGLDEVVFLEKPFRISELLDTVQSLLDPARDEEESS